MAPAPTRPPAAPTPASSVAHPAALADAERLSSLARLAVVMAHEVRNPLLLMKMALRTLRGSDLSAPQREAVSDLHEQVERVTGLVTDILDFARPLRFTFGAADLNAICADAAEAAMAGEPEPRVHLTLDPSLPEIVTDRERLRSALVNLLVNARQAVNARVAPAGGWARDERAIVLETRSCSPGRAGIIVRDRGIGIPERDLPRVFEPYFTTKRGGTGIGLALVKNIVNGFEGTIQVTSQAGVGTEVRVSLPFEPAGWHRQHETTSNRLSVRPCILVIDDDASMRELLATALHLSGFVVATASNGADGLKRAREIQPAVVLLDLMMPVMDGTHFREAQLRDPRIARVPVICISSVDPTEEPAVRLRPAAYIVKPFDMDQIVSAVRMHCRTNCELAATCDRGCAVVATF